MIKYNIMKQIINKKIKRKEAIKEIKIKKIKFIINILKIKNKNLILIN